MSSKALEPQGNLPSTTSERAETRTGYRKPKDKVVDTQHVVDVLPMFEVGSTGQAWYSKHAKELQAPDEGGQHASGEVEQSQDLLESRSKALEPADNMPGQAGGHSMQDGPQIPSKENQRARTNSETIANVPDPPGTPMKHPTPHVEHSRLQHRASAQACSAMTTEFDLLRTRRSGKRREMQRLKLDCKRAPGRPKRTYQGCSTSETPPDEARGMGVHRPTQAGKGDSMDVKSKTTKLEIREISARTVETRAHLPHWDMTQKEPDKAGDTGGRGDDTASKDFVDLHGVEKTLLAISRSQQGEQEAKRLRCLPAAPAPSPNGILDMPTLFMDLRRRERAKPKAENVSNAHSRQSAYLTQTALKRPLPLLPTHSNRSLDATRGSQMTNVRCNRVRHAWKVKTRGRTYWIARILMWLL
ncbi:hypothetical protein F5141DRAFT_1208690 [Pisolithus sp. B1]|nr:hypothetical protein F5141DRAFT_1208690 [Pisolithus sp. B1]